MVGGFWTALRVRRLATRMVGTAQEEASSTPITSLRATRGLGEDDFRRGFVVVGVGTGEQYDFDAPAGATVCVETWTPGGTTAFVYAGASSRLLRTEVVISKTSDRSPERHCRLMHPHHADLFAS